MTNTQRAYLELHFAVLLFGFTAILGGLIQLPTLSLVWWRLLITCSALMIYGGIFSKIRALPSHLIRQYMLIGCVVMVHWLAFYGSIKLANASVSLICFATISFISALIEPLILKQKIKWYEVGLGIVIIPAMGFIATNLPSGMGWGFVVGMISAFLAALFSVLNKRLVNEADPISITFLNLSGGGLLLTVILSIVLWQNPDMKFLPTSTMDWVYLFVLALLCTNLGYWLALRSLRHLSAFATNLTVNLEPVYGILMAVAILKEDKQLTPAFYIGGLIILITVLSYPWVQSKFEKKASI
jgi:drug/metabolite transporter (DMT)-like permease